MSDVIKLLPDSLANQIAAGEVVQRPASIVKELLENALDAGSKHVRLIIKDAGKSFIQVSDDGNGMSETDLRMAFERHATSKIKHIEDLFSIGTFGFRGEALASIAAVAKVEAKSRRPQDELASELHIEDSNTVHQGLCSANVGTTITVKNLFFNVPARKNFLKSDQVEFKHIQEELFRVALPNPDLRFDFISNSEEVLRLTGASLKQRVVQLFGKKYESLLVPVEEHSTMLRIKGFIGKPEAARKSRGEQYFFVNNRYIKSPYLHHAVKTAFEQLIPKESHPFYVIFLSLDPARVDLNVHPTKTEVKLEDERSIYAMLQTCLRKALSQHHVAPSLDFSREDSLNFEASSNKDQSSVLGFQRPSSFSQPSGSSSIPAPKNSFSQKEAEQGWKELYRVLDAEKEAEEAANQPVLPSLYDAEESIESSNEIKHPIQLSRKYIITTIKSGLVIINQALAHQRIIYERQLQLLSGDQSVIQQELFPEQIELSPTEYQTFTLIKPKLSMLGFDIEGLSQNTVVVNGRPAFLRPQGLSVSEALTSIINEYEQGAKQGGLGPEERLARSIALSTALKAGQTLDIDMMNALINQLFACEMPFYAPDGAPVMISISSEELDNKFKR